MSKKAAAILKAARCEAIREAAFADADRRGGASS